MTAEFVRALQAHNAHQVLSILLRTISQDVRGFHSSFISKLSGPVFSEVLRILDPEVFLTRWLDLLRDLQAHERSKLGSLPYDVVHGYERISHRFMAQIGAIIRARRRTSTLTTSDWTCLLQCARISGHVPASEAIWTDFMFSSKTQMSGPNAQCYNIYLSTLASVYTYDDTRKSQLAHLTSNRMLPAPRQPLHIGHPTSKPQVRTTTLRTFEEMVSKGHVGNEETFCSILIALGRERHLEAVAALLKRVWRINVEHLDMERLPIFPVNHPLRPSACLLRTIIHVYGTNGSMGLGLRLIDAITRQYDLKLDARLWEGIFEWMRFACLRQFSERATRYATDQQSNMIDVWNTMVSEPHNFVPTMRMYACLIDTLLRTKHYDEAVFHMEAAEYILQRRRSKLSMQQMSFMRSFHRLPTSIRNERIRFITFAQWKIQREELLLKRWVQTVFKGYSRLGDPAISLIYLPQFIHRWARWLPRKLTYFAPSGVVEFSLAARLSINNLDRQRSRPEEVPHPKCSSMLRGDRFVRFVQSNNYSPAAQELMNDVANVYTRRILRRVAEQVDKPLSPRRSLKQRQSRRTMFMSTHQIQRGGRHIDGKKRLRRAGRSRLWIARREARQYRRRRIPAASRTLPRLKSKTPAASQLPDAPQSTNIPRAPSREQRKQWEKLVANRPDVATRMVGQMDRDVWVHL